MTNNYATGTHMPIDPFTIEICRNRLDSIVQEMATALIKTSSSPTTTETKDFSCSLFDHQGRQLSFAGYILYHASSNWEGIEAIRREFPASEIEDGDVFIANDPCFGGGIHPGDVCVFQPHFNNGKIIAWSACASHQIDVGGAVPGGWNSTATECYAEALLMPPVKIARRGNIDRSMWMLLMNNIRMPDRVGLDFKGLIASNSVAGRRLRELAQLYGNDQFIAMQDRILELSEVSMKRRIAELASGTYSAVDWIENNGHQDGLWRVACDLHVSREGMVFDFNRSDPQTQGFVNCGPSGMGGGALVHIIQMFGYDIPYNDGFLRPFKFVADRGKIVNAAKPAPISAGHMNAAFKIQEVVQACINKMLAASPPPWRSRAMGMWADNWTLHLCYGLNREGAFEIYINMDGGGCGGAALPMRDGIPVAGCPQQCGMDLPDVEFNEMNFPLLFHFKKLRTNSGGAGRYRGGLGMEYAWSIYGVPEMNLVLFNQRYKVPQYGMFGADIVSSSIFAHYRNTDLKMRLEAGSALPISRDEIFGQSEVTSVNDLTRILTDSDIFYVANCGGGGYGDPVLRDPTLVLCDVRDGYVSADVARSVYGVVLTSEDTADIGGTQRLRDEIRRARLASANAGQRGPTELGQRDMVVHEHSPAICVGRYGENLIFQCAQCQTLLGAAEGNWKTKVPRIERPIDADYLERYRLEVGLRSDPAILARHYLCPGCGTVLEVEMTIEGDAVHHDSQPDNHHITAEPMRVAG
jgi:N-methylhydantoinase B